MLKTIREHLKIITTCNLYLDYFVLGMACSLTGPCLLDLQYTVHTDTQHIALIYTARSIGYLIGAIVAGVLLDRLKSKLMVLMMFNCFITATIFAIPWCRSVDVLMGFMVVNGIALGAIETGNNVVCLQIWGKESGPYFQGMHFSFGVGALISPLIAAPFLENSGEFSSTLLADNSSTLLEVGATLDNLTDALISSHGNATYYASSGISTVTFPFSIVGVCVTLVTILFLVISLVSPTEGGEVQSDQETNSGRSFAFMFFTVAFSFLLLFVGIGTEIGFGQALATYAVKGRLHATISVASYMTSVYWATFTASRLVYVFLAFKIHNLLLVVSNITIVACSGLVLLFCMPNAWAGWLAPALFGAGVGPFYASMVGYLASYIHVDSKISALVTVGCAAGEMVCPFLITYFLETVPDMLAFVVSGSTVVMSILLVVLHCILRSGGDSKSGTPGDKKLECYVIDGHLAEQGCEQYKSKELVVY